MSRPRTFFLKTTPKQGVPQLLGADQEHALKVLRIRAGSRIVGVDGRGQAWELEVVSADRRRLELAPSGPPRLEPAPGAPGAALPWIDVCTPLPKGSRAESLMGSITQLGAARLIPLVTEHCESQARTLPESRVTRLERAAQEALKQCGRLWMPEIAHSGGLDSLLKKPGQRVILDPGADGSLSEYLSRQGADSRPTRSEPFQLIFGPEGGLSGSEQALLIENGAVAVRVSPHVLRIETAVQATLAIVAEHCMSGD